MSKADARLVELEAEEVQRQLDGSLYLRRTYAERRAALVKRICESQQLLDQLDKEHEGIDERIPRLERKLAELKKERTNALHRRDIERLEDLRSKAAALEKKLGKGRTSE